MKSDIKVFNCGLWYNGKMHKGIYFAGMMHDALYAQGYINDDGVADYKKIWKEVDWTFRFEVTGVLADGRSCKTPFWVRLIEDGLIIYNNGEVQSVGKSTSATLSCATPEEAQKSAKEGARVYGQEPVRRTGGVFIGKLHQTETVIRKKREAGTDWVMNLGSAGMSCSAYYTGQATYDQYSGIKDIGGAFTIGATFWPDIDSDTTLTAFEWGSVPVYIAPITQNNDSWKRSSGLVLNNTFKCCQALTESPAACLEKMEETNGELYQLNGTYWESGIREIREGEFLKVHPLGWNFTFCGCSGLKSLPNEIIGGTFNVPGDASFYGTFQNCKNIAKLPEKLCRAGTAKGTFTTHRMFANCSGLTNLPETFFEGCEGALIDASLMFAGAFKKYGNVRAKAGLFKPLVEAAKTNPWIIGGIFKGSNLEYVDADLLKPFAGMRVSLLGSNYYEDGDNLYKDMFSSSDLRNVPEGFLDGICGGFGHGGGYTINVQNIFRYCSLLKNVPENIFDKLDWQYYFKAADSMDFFSNSFEGCSYLKHLPPLWEQYGTKIVNYWSSYYAYSYDTFKGCTRADNYWKCPAWCKGVRDGGFRYERYAKITKEEYDRIAELNKKNGYNG